MLKGPRLTLRPVTRDDLSHYVTWLNDPEVVRHLGVPGLLTMDDEVEWYEAQRKNDSVIHFAIDTENDQHIGSISLMSIDRQNQTAAMGILIGDKTAWGQGYCTEALSLLLDYAFNMVNLNRVFLQVDVDNIGGITCYKRCGFIQEGELRQVVFREGKFINQYIMSVLRDEYRQRAG